MELGMVSDIEKNVFLRALKIPIIVLNVSKRN